MTLSNASEFIPWIIQNNSKKTFSKNNMAEIQNLGNVEKHPKWAPAEFIEEGDKNSSEKGRGDDPAVPDQAIEENEDSDMNAGSEIIEVEEGNAGVEVRVEEINDPELMPTYTPVEYREYGEVEYLRGYNSCKDNEHLEFSDRLDQLNILIDTLKKEYVDLSEFYDPLRELMAKAIESIMQVELPESKDSISNIVSTMLEEMAIEADGEIRVFLNPNDAALLKDINSSSKSPVRLLSDHRLTRGSARAVMGDSIIESMKENRVADIVNQILGEKSKKITKPLRKKRINAKNIKPVRK